jgi:LmbE family N-acetylglucosaminyl deacetylase
MSLRILHLAPHPDDEAIACPAILSSLAEAGHRVDNLACSLGRVAQKEQRLEELERSCDFLGIHLVLPDPLPSINSSDDPAEAEAEVVDILREMADDYDIIISPSTTDLHPGHEAVGRAVRSVLRGKEGSVWWQWGLWSDLSLPSILYPFGEDEMDTSLQVLECHVGEITRNDYRRLVIGRAEMNAILAPERCFGFGVKGIDYPYAELLTELTREEGKWRLGVPRLLDPSDPLRDGKEEMMKRDPAYLRGRTKEEEWNLTPDVTDIIESSSVTEILRASRV